MLFLAYTDGLELHNADGVPPDGPWLEICRLRPGLALIASEQRRSVVYHAIKDLLPPDTPLLVAQTERIPKFKGMEPGALAWARAHAPDT